MPLSACIFYLLHYFPLACSLTNRVASYFLLHHNIARGYEIKIHDEENVLPTSTCTNSKNVMFISIVRERSTQYTDCVYLLVSYKPHADIHNSRDEGRDIGGSIGHRKILTLHGYQAGWLRLRRLKHLLDTTFRLVIQVKVR
jgi:hypothetical protein